MCFKRTIDDQGSFGTNIGNYTIFSIYNISNYAIHNDIKDYCDNIKLFQVIALLLGTIYFGQVLDQDGILNINGALFIFLTNITFQHVFAVINVRGIIFKYNNLSSIQIAVNFVIDILLRITCFLIRKTIWSLRYWYILFGKNYIRISLLLLWNNHFYKFSISANNV